MQALTTTDEWQELKNNNQKFIAIAKLSPICPTSFSAERVITEWEKSIDESKIALFSVNVIQARPLSNALADEFNIVHQSPQFIFLDPTFKVLDSQSHYGIDADFLNDCVNQSQS